MVVFFFFTMLLCNFTNLGQSFLSCGLGLLGDRNHILTFLEDLGAGILIKGSL